MHDDGTLYYAHYTPQLHYRGIALDDDDNMMNECWPWPPISVPFLQHRVAQINQTVLITGCDNVHYLCTDNVTTLCTLYSVCVSPWPGSQPRVSPRTSHPVHTTSENVCTPHIEYYSGLVSCGVNYRAS